MLREGVAAVEVCPADQIPGSANSTFHVLAVGATGRAGVHDRAGRQSESQGCHALRVGRRQSKDGTVFHTLRQRDGWMGGRGSPPWDGRS